jgi:hypothetical protein
LLASTHTITGGTNRLRIRRRPFFCKVKEFRTSRGEAIRNAVQVISHICRFRSHAHGYAEGMMDTPQFGEGAFVAEYLLAAAVCASGPIAFYQHSNEEENRL